MPHVDTADEAREVVQKLKYPPVGHRSMGGTGPHYGLRSASTGDAATALNAANLTVVMLETPTAIANADEIAAVPGVDVLLIGTNDLCAEMGIHGDFGNERVADAYRTMIAASKKHGKVPGHGRHLQRAAHAALHRDGRALHPVRQRRRVPDGERHAAHRLPAQDPHTNVTRVRRGRFTSTRWQQREVEHVTRAWVSLRSTHPTVTACARCDCRMGSAERNP